MHDTSGLIVVSADRYLRGARGFREDCAWVRRGFTEDGAMQILDPRIPAGAYERLLDMVLRYFRQPCWRKLGDERIDAGHEVGWTPPFTEMTKFKDVDHLVEERGLKTRPHAVRHKDPKERFMYRIGDDPPGGTAFGALHAPQVIPAAFAGEWDETINGWAPYAKQAMLTALEMLAVGFELESDFFTKLFRYGPHLFAPTGVNLDQYAEPGTVLAAVHRDIGALTGHGPSNVPGQLFIWKRNGERIPARGKPGGVLLQAALELTFTTGGEVMDGMHEVVFTEEAFAAMAAMHDAGLEAWRASTTIFMHEEVDGWVEPQGPFRTAETIAKYPRIKAGDQVLEELGITGVGAGG